MDEQSDLNQRPHYIWPRFVLGGVVLGLVLAIFWMLVLVHRLRNERESMTWPAQAQPVPANTNSPVNATNISNHP